MVSAWSACIQRWRQRAKLRKVFDTGDCWYAVSRKTRNAVQHVKKHAPAMGYEPLRRARRSQMEKGAGMVLLPVSCRRALVDLSDAPSAPSWRRSCCRAVSGSRARRSIHSHRSDRISDRRRPERTRIRIAAMVDGGSLPSAGSGASATRVLQVSRMLIPTARPPQD